MNLSAQREAIFERLKHSLQLLASPADVQLSLLPANVCRADELALEFDHWYEVVLSGFSANITAEQRQFLARIDEKLDLVTAQGKQMWTDEALRSESVWREIRQISISTLESFNWPVAIPPSHADEYRFPK